MFCLNQCIFPENFSLIEQEIFKLICFGQATECEFKKR